MKLSPCLLLSADEAIATALHARVSEGPDIEIATSYFGFAIMGASLRKRIGLTTGYVDYYNTTPKEGRRRKSMNRRDVDRTLFEHIDALAAELPAQVQEHLLTCDRLPGFLYRLFTCQSMTTRLRRRSFVIQSPRPARISAISLRRSPDTISGYVVMALARNCGARP